MRQVGGGGRPRLTRPRSQQRQTHLTTIVQIGVEANHPVSRGHELNLGTFSWISIRNQDVEEIASAVVRTRVIHDVHHGNEVVRMIFCGKQRDFFRQVLVNTRQFLEPRLATFVDLVALVGERWSVDRRSDFALNLRYVARAVQ